ncbi:hypothetical protein ACHQM5_019850 [Ranunculus cassubicifolius]
MGLNLIEYLFRWKSASRTWRAKKSESDYALRIYVGDDKVIHFTRGQEVGTRTMLDLLLVSSGPARGQIPCSICRQEEEGNGVVSSCLDCFLAGGVLYRFEYAVTPALFIAKARGGTCTLAVSDPDDSVVHRAKYLLANGFGCYNIFNKNCEDFAIYCKTGLVDQITLGQSGQAVSVIGGPLARGGTCTFAVSDPDDSVVHRAKYLLANGLRCYNIFNKNCEDFAIYCKTGLVDQITLGQSGQAVSIIGGPLAGILSSPLRLVTTNIYGMAVTAVGVYCVSRYAADIGRRKDMVKLEAEDLTTRLATGRLRVGETLSVVPAISVR